MVFIEIVQDIIIFLSIVESRTFDMSHTSRKIKITEREIMILSRKVYEIGRPYFPVRDSSSIEH